MRLALGRVPLSTQAGDALVIRLRAAPAARAALPDGSPRPIKKSLRRSRGQEEALQSRPRSARRARPAASIGNGGIHGETRPSRWARSLKKMRACAAGRARTSRLCM
jgi:hypothetical protein